VLLGYDDDDSSQKKRRFRLVRGTSSFANSAPILLVTRRAVAALNRDLEAASAKPVTAAHFRANLVVSEAASTGDNDFVEDEWTAVSVANLRFDVTGPCERCAAVDVDPETATKRDGGVVLRTLASLRLKARTQRAKVTFGVFLASTKPPEDLKEDDDDDPVVGHVSRGDALAAFTEAAS